ncbi:50S ribosomal protein L33, partial [Lacticaseibacillus paracasei]|uniref:50S ribosomal protein L33 n=1 Tax=Lacticaseibacillus paracasei TaxID=1597 RepID=UPI0030E8B961
MRAKKVALACSVCGHRNYFVPENPKRTERLTLQKFCTHGGGVTVHPETKSPGTAPRAG